MLRLAVSVDLVLARTQRQSALRRRPSSRAGQPVEQPGATWVAQPERKVAAATAQARESTRSGDTIPCGPSDAQGGVAVADGIGRSGRKGPAFPAGPRQGPHPARKLAPAE